jgi:ADP-ribose pyrophosphatase YjhB (NUDIX family)
MSNVSIDEQTKRVLALFESDTTTKPEDPKTALADFERMRQDIYKVWRPLHAPSDLGLLNTIYGIYNPSIKHAMLVKRSADDIIALDSGRKVSVSEGYTFYKPFLDNLRPFPDEIVYHNPKTVVVGLMRSPSGVVLTRRAEHRTRGQLALPAGFQENKDRTWENALCREVLEETGIVLNPKHVRQYHTQTVADGAINLLFAFYMRMVPEPPHREPDDEVMEIVTTNQLIDLAFETHTEALRAFLRINPIHFKPEGHE